MTLRSQLAIVIADTSCLTPSDADLAKWSDIQNEVANEVVNLQYVMQQDLRIINTRQPIVLPAQLGPPYGSFTQYNPGA